MKEDNNSLAKVINLLSDLVVFNHYDFDKFLQKLIKVIAEVILVDSCFIYFYDRDKKRLILVGSKKPHKEKHLQPVWMIGQDKQDWI